MHLVTSHTHTHTRMHVGTHARTHMYTHAHTHTEPPSDHAMLVVWQGYGIPQDKQNVKVPFVYEGQEYTLRHGSVVIAAITSCTNTSNPSVMLGAGVCVCVCVRERERERERERWIWMECVCLSE